MYNYMCFLVFAFVITLSNAHKKTLYDLVLGSQSVGLI